MGKMIMIKYKKIIISNILLVLLLASAIHPLHATDDIYQVSSGPEEILDQTQENCSYEEGVHHHVMLAQSFIPSLSPLTKIDVKINKPRKTVLPLIISVKKSLDSSSLTSTVIPAEDVPFFSHWIMADIDDIDVIPGETYHIVLSTPSPSETPYRWYFDYNENNDPYQDGKMFRSFNNGNDWESVETDYDFVDAAFRTYSYIGYTDLSCTGFLNWTNVKPAQDNLTGFFTVRNDGTPYSKLNWKIQNWPGWGTWQFSQKNGENLCPEDGTITITINIEAPHSNVPDSYDGKIVIINEDNINDTCVIQAKMETSKSKSDIEDESSQQKGINNILFQIQKDIITSFNKSIKLFDYIRTYLPQNNRNLFDCLLHKGLW